MPSSMIDSLKCSHLMEVPPGQGAKKVGSFTACPVRHRASWSWHLLTRTSFQPAPKTFWWAELILQLFCNLNSSKNFTSQNSSARKQNPLAPGYLVTQMPLVLYCTFTIERKPNIYFLKRYVCFLKRINVGYSQKSDRKSEKAIKQTGLTATDNKNVRFIQKKKKKTICLTIVIISGHIFGSHSEIFRIPSRDKDYRKRTEKLVFVCQQISTDIIFPLWHAMKIGPLQPYSRANRGGNFLYLFIIKKNVSEPAILISRLLLLYKKENTVVSCH